MMCFVLTYVLVLELQIKHTICQDSSIAVPYIQCTGHDVNRNQPFEYYKLM